MRRIEIAPELWLELLERVRSGSSTEATARGLGIARAGLYAQLRQVPTRREELDAAQAARAAGRAARSKARAAAKAREKSAERQREREQEAAMVESPTPPPVAVAMPPKIRQTRAKRPGPPTKYPFTAERRRVMLAVFAEGGTLEQAAAAAGVPRVTVSMTWLREPGLLAEVEAAKLEHTRRLAAAVERARAGAPEAQLEPAPVSVAARRLAIARAGVVPVPAATAPVAPPPRRAKAAPAPRIDKRPPHTHVTLTQALLAARDAADAVLERGLGKTGRFPRPEQWNELRTLCHTLSGEDRASAVVALVIECADREHAEDRVRIDYREPVQIRHVDDAPPPRPRPRTACGTLATDGTSAPAPAAAEGGG